MFSTPIRHSSKLMSTHVILKICHSITGDNKLELKKEEKENKLRSYSNMKLIHLQAWKLTMLFMIIMYFNQIFNNKLNYYHHNNSMIETRDK